MRIGELLNPELILRDIAKENGILYPYFLSIVRNINPIIEEVTFEELDNAIIEYHDDRALDDSPEPYRRGGDGRRYR